MNTDDNINFKQRSFQSEKRWNKKSNFKSVKETILSCESIFARNMKSKL